MKFNLRSRAAAAFSILLLAAASFGWDDAGHKLSARIAWEVMTPAARERAVKILLSAPEDSDLSVLYNSFGGRPEEVIRLELFTYASTWPDVVRNRSFAARYEKYHKSNWHYGDIFWGEDGKALKDFPEPSGIAVRKLADFERTLRSADSTDADKAIALAWFLHVAGDLHNPLHNASRVTATEPKGDQGGNLFYLEPAKDDGSWRLNLHSFWDSQITRNVPRDATESDTDYLEPIARIDLALNPPAIFEEKLKLGDYVAWNLEGFSYLPTTVYANGLVRERIPDEVYNAVAFRLSLEQLALAGYRIGETLNSIFDPKPAAANRECRIIRTITYPVSKKDTRARKPAAALLDICPADGGRVARPVISVTDANGASVLEYDLIRTFEDREAALDYARKHGLNNIKID